MNIERTNKIVTEAALKIVRTWRLSIGALPYVESIIYVAIAKGHEPAAQPLESLMTPEQAEAWGQKCEQFFAEMKTASGTPAAQPVVRICECGHNEIQHCHFSDHDECTSDECECDTFRPAAQPQRSEQWVCGTCGASATNPEGAASSEQTRGEWTAEALKEIYQDSNSWEQVAEAVNATLKAPRGSVFNRISGSTALPYPESE
jgi:hypothetical protein